MVKNFGINIETAIERQSRVESHRHESHREVVEPFIKPVVQKKAVKKIEPLYNGLSLKQIKAINLRNWGVHI